MNDGLEKEKVLILITTEKDFETAESLSEKLLDSNLIACVSLTEQKSLYWWDGKIQKSNEVKLLIKCNPLSLKKIIKLIKHNHSYQLPEILFWEVLSTGDYANWIKSICV